MKVWLLLGLGFFAGLPVHAETENSGGSAEQGGRKNITLGAMFREEFKQQEGVKELKNGILYKSEAVGTGRTPKLSDRVKVRYQGRHVDGRIFDQTGPEETREFRLNRDVISGWQEVLPLMREGDRWDIVIPSHLAYGAKGHPYGKIESNETLVFTIELVEILEPGTKKVSPPVP